MRKKNTLTHTLHMLHYNLLELLWIRRAENRILSELLGFRMNMNTIQIVNMSI